MGNLEFYIYENNLWFISSDGMNEPLTEDHSEFISSTILKIKEMFPDAYKALTECYKRSSRNIPHFQYLSVRRFCKCNCGSLDNTSKDVDEEGGFHLENVQCPLRGECQYEGRICKPIFNTKISSSEMRVMRLYYQGWENQRIAEGLYISPHTVKNHIKSVYLKLGIHEKAEFIKYAHKNNLFKD